MKRRYTLLKLLLFAGAALAKSDVSSCFVEHDFAGIPWDPSTHALTSDLDMLGTQTKFETPVNGIRLIGVCTDDTVTSGSPVGLRTVIRGYTDIWLDPAFNLNRHGNWPASPSSTNCYGINFMVGKGLQNVKFWHNGNHITEF